MKTFVKKPVNASSSKNASDSVKRVVAALVELESAVNALPADQLEEFEVITDMTVDFVSDARFNYAYETGVVMSVD